MRYLRYVAIGAAGGVILLMLSGCNPEARGFALPLGSTDAGREAFERLECRQCHGVANQLEKDLAGHPEIHFVLGGTTTRIRTYGDLVTSIINPNHKISGYRNAEVNLDEQGNTRMPSHNEVMTVQELIDLTTYLQSTYEVIRPEPRGMYYP